tara:strand:- start:288 stop:506 length:219 start_codon:yes stop_codon:yes gene_type:complete
MKNWPTWECEPSNFKYFYKEKETCLIIKGEAIIKTSAEIFNIRSGDLIIFPKGFDCTWEVRKAIKKHYRVGD